jgi:hypothetical protein
MKFRSPGDDIVLTKELAEMRDELTPKQIEFAHHLVAQENRKTATECAIMAGYSPKTARQIASQLQSHKEYPKVAKGKRGRFIFGRRREGDLFLAGGRGS